jgi:hypothetical protein
MEIKKKRNGRKYSLNGTKNGRRRRYTLIEVEYTDKEDNSYPGFACLGSKGGVKRNFRYIGESVALAVESVETQFDVIIMNYEQVFE